MNVQVKCPECDNTFYESDWRDWAECYRCDTVFEMKPRVIFGM